MSVDSICAGFHQAPAGVLAGGSRASVAEVLAKSAPAGIVPW